MNNKYPINLIAALLLLVFPLESFAESCPAHPLESAVSRDNSQIPEDDNIRISADESEIRESGETLLSGHVEIERLDKQLSATEVAYNRETEHLRATGNVVFSDPLLTLEGDQLEYDLGTDQGTLENGFYSLKGRPSHGSAKKIIRQGDKQRLEQATYTGCPPGAVSWQITADAIDLDLEANQGQAKDLTLTFKGVPLFYAPSLSFPLSKDRKSGFLVPSLGSSSDSGTEFSTPYYWNIAPNMDATLTPGVMGKRGATLDGEFRYLTEKVEGESSLTYLPSDDLRQGEDRKAFLLEHQGKISKNWDYEVDFNYVSDDEYFEDFGGSLAASSVSHLERKFASSYQGDSWWLDARTRSFQTLIGSKPYQELPRISFGQEGNIGNSGFEYQLVAEYADFDHQDKVVTGRRIDLYPSFSYPMRKGHYFVEPKVGLRYTNYDLSDQVAGLSESPDRSTPIVSIDSGLFLERDVNLWGLGLVQTLEPRMFYLNIPSRNQDDIPLFDTTLYDFNFSQLFRENRFAGGDRIGDANQLTTALTSRMLNPRTGGELLQASIGYIQNFEDRKVQLTPALPEDNESSSEIVTALAARLSRGLTSRAEWQWDPHESQSTRNTYGLRYQPDDQRILNLAYRQRRDAVSKTLIEQTDISAAWPIVEHWRFVGRSNYSLKDNQSLETFAGLEYESCCYVVRFLHRQYVRDLTEDVNRAFMIQLELTGLTGIGDRIEELLADDILGYDPDRY